MSHFLNLNAWVWNGNKPILTEVKKYGPDSFMLRFNIENNNAEVSMNRETFVALSAKMRNILLDEGPLTPPEIKPEP